MNPATPPLPRVRLRFGRWFADTYQVVRRNPLPLLALGAVSSIVSSAAAAGFAAVLARAVLTGFYSTDFVLLSTWVPLCHAGLILVAGLVQLQCTAMIVHLVLVRLGRRSGPASGWSALAAAWRATASVLPRALVLFAAMAAAAWLAWVWLGSFLQQRFTEALLARNTIWLGGFIVITALVLLVGVLVAVMLQVRWFWFVPVLVNEAGDGIRALRRSWQLTAGSAATILAGLLVSTLASEMVVSLVGRVVSAPFPAPELRRDIDSIMAFVMRQVVLNAVVGGLIGAFVVTWLAVLAAVGYAQRTGAPPATLPTAPSPSPDWPTPQTW